MRIGKRIDRIDGSAMRRSRTLTARRWTSNRGNVTAELAAIVPVIVLLGIGGFEFGRLALEKLSATSAARAGAQYGTMDFAAAADTAGMTQAALDDLGDTGGAWVVDPTPGYCYCPADGAVACTATCSDGSYSMMYVEVTVRRNIDLLFDYPGVTSPFPVESSVRMRVR